jgi:hypothetical protein
MKPPISSILRAASRRPDEPLNVLTFPTHERTEVNLAKTAHNFYGWQPPGGKTWNATFAPLPANYNIVDGDDQPNVPSDVAFDVVLSQNRYAQYQRAKRFASMYQIPLVCLEHCLPDPQCTEGTMKALRTMHGDVDVFISEYSRNTWGCPEGHVIEHGVDTDLFKPNPHAVRWTHIMAAVNQWIQRDRECGFTFWKEVTDGLPCFVMGDTPGLSRPAASVDELVFRYQTAQIFINTAQISPVPTTLLEAMSCGCAVVSTANPMVESVIENGVNGFVTNDKVEMRRILERLLSDPDECRGLGEAARQTIVSRFSLPRFVNDWNTVFREVVK